MYSITLQWKSGDKMSIRLLKVNTYKSFTFKSYSAYHKGHSIFTAYTGPQMLSVFVEAVFEHHSILVAVEFEREAEVKYIEK